MLRFKRTYPTARPEDPQVLRDIRELLYILTSEVVDNHPMTYLEKRFKEFQEKRMEEEK